MEKIVIKNGTVQETLMLPLYGRVYCNKHYPKTFPDKTAQKVAERVEYDFSKLTFKPSAMVVWALRSRVLADCARKYLKEHPKATIVSMGCGLDLTFEQVDNGTCRFINVDLPDVIAARESIVQCREREYNMAADLLDFSWMKKIKEAPYHANTDEGVYFICGGVLMYFKDEQNKELFMNLLEEFPGGGIAFDGENAAGVRQSNKIVRKTGNGTMIYFPVDDAKALFASWSPDFRNVREMQKLPAYVKEGGEVPLGTRMFLNMGMRLGMFKFIAVRFESCFRT